MKGLKLSLIVLTATLLTIGLSGMAFAFHSGGVAECEGCHSMHSPKAGGYALLVGTDVSSTCLSCHMSSEDTGPNGYHISTVESKLGPTLSPLQRGPAGDFGWVKKTYSWVSSGQTQTEDGQTHGHNIIATDFNYTVDTRFATSPGGTYPSSQLACSSCHDPHGKGRQLSDGTYAFTGAPIIGSGSYSTSTPPKAGEAIGLYRLLRTPLYSNLGFNAYPIAVAPSTYNRTEAVTQTRVAYGGTGNNTWGNWCATCHADMHSKNGYVHPVDQNLGTDVANNYNSYVKSGDLTGTSAKAYLSLVPFAEKTGDFKTLASHAKNDDSYLNGPATADTVMCLSCHRAHASGFLNALRFDQGYEFMTKAGDYIGTDNPAMTGSRAPVQTRGRSVAEWKAAYYDRPASVFATYQRVLCNKCHAKD
jgi:hypothetical protein